jgi:hypothetical protein
MTMELDLPLDIALGADTGLPLNSVLVAGPNAHPAISGTHQSYAESVTHLEKLNQQLSGSGCKVRYHRLTPQERAHYAAQDLQDLLWVEQLPARVDQDAFVVSTTKMLNMPLPVIDFVAI